MSLLDTSGIPRRHLQAEVDTTGPWGAAWQRIESSLGKGALILLCGTRGSGKTQLACEAVKRACTNGRTGRYFTAMDIFIDIKGTYRHDAKESEKQLITRLSTPTVLAIDEIGKRGETEWENNLMFHIIDKRYQNLVDTILVTNQTAADAIKSLGASLSSRMQECGGVKIGRAHV